MVEPITYRHNMLTIQSLDTFLNVKGGYHNGFRDVYFIRALGESSDLQAIIDEMDRKMNAEMEANRLIYRRITKLPQITEREDIKFYSEAYSDWKQTGKVRLRTQYKNDRFKNVFSSAVERAIEKYKAVIPGTTETIVKNFAVKLWYWSDVLLEDVIEMWSERICVKVVTNHVTKVQEYLFYYLTTLIGCDALIINNRSDLKAPSDVTDLSAVFTLGPYGKKEFADYIPPRQEEKRAKRTVTVSTDSYQGAATVRPVERPAGSQSPLDARAPHTETILHNTNAAGTAVNGVSVYPRKGRVDTSSAISHVRNRGGNSDTDVCPRQEKTFEELALLASSIVMIAVHDAKGDMVATGSGIMIGREGFILTNFHVVRTGRVYAVRIEDDKTVYITDEIIKYNSQLDLAVIRIDRELKPLPIYNRKQKLARGQKVVTIGSPLGFFNSVSDGIISGFRIIRDVDMIQFTAPISHGSSGGAVINLYGEVIGISTAGIDSGQNINLAVGYDSIRMFTKGFYELG